MSMHRCLVIVQVPAYPLTGGVAIRNWQTLNLLQQLGEVAIFSIHKGQPQAMPEQAKQSWGHFHYDIGRPQRSLIEKLKNRLGRFRPDGHPYPDWLYTRAGANALTACLQKFQPTLVIFEELWAYHYLQIVETYARSTRCAIVLDNHNVEGQKEDYRGHQRHIQQIRKIEGRFAHRVNQVWVCSAHDATQLTQLYGRTRSTHIIPNSVQLEFYQSVFATRMAQDTSPVVAQSVLFIGKFSYAPNEAAALILLRDIYPALQQRYPAAQLWLVGRDPTPAMRAAQIPGVQITGLVEDVRPYLARAAVMAVPLREGGGTRLKLLEAFAAGCPTVSTAKGAEGLQVIDAQHLYLRDSIEAMVTAIVQLWQSPDQGKTLAHNAHRLLQQEYSWQTTQQRIQTALEQLP